MLKYSFIHTGTFSHFKITELHNPINACQTFRFHTPNNNLQQNVQCTSRWRTAPKIPTETCNILRAYYSNAQVNEWTRQFDSSFWVGSEFPINMQSCCQRTLSCFHKKSKSSNEQIKKQHAAQDDKAYILIYTLNKMKHSNDTWN